MFLLGFLSSYQVDISVNHYSDLSLKLKVRIISFCILNFASINFCNLSFSSIIFLFFHFLSISFENLIVFSWSSVVYFTTIRSRHQDCHLSKVQYCLMKYYSLQTNWMISKCCNFETPPNRLALREAIISHLAVVDSFP